MNLIVETFQSIGKFPSMDEIQTLSHSSEEEILAVAKKSSSKFFDERIKYFSLTHNFNPEWCFSIQKKQKKKYLILTKVGYPFGGGESFMFQTIKWMTEIGFEVHWISFTDKNHVNYTRREDYYRDECNFHKIVGGVTPENLERCISLLSPDVIHIQGVMSMLSVSTILKMRIPVIVGYHFWFGLLEANQYGGFNNVDIIGNISSHKVSDFYLKCSEEHLISQYVVSDFMNDVLRAAKTKEIENVIYATSSDEQFLVKRKSPMERKYITLVNINRLKGGDIFLEIAKRINLPMMGVCTENNTDGLDEEIRSTIEKKRGLFLNHTDIHRVYDDTRILLLPGHVDETFCRVAYEGAACGIPIITTGVGFIKYLLDDAAVYLSSDPKEWIDVLNGLYYNRFALEIFSQKGIEQAKKFTSSKSRLQSLVLERSLLSKKNGVAIFCPWCDQGLGIQSKEYALLLKECGYEVSIFSFLPFLAYKKNHYFQKDDKEWKIPGVRVHYSFNDREGVTLQELEHFVFSRNIGKFIIPEICFHPIFEKVDFLNSLGVEVFAIPNIETTRRDELSLHSKFKKILTNTRVCHSILEESGVGNLHYIGHFCSQKKKINKYKKEDFSTISFLHVSGYNATTRKQSLKVCHSLLILREEYPELYAKVRVTFTSSKRVPTELLDFLQLECLTFDTRELSYSQIRDYYSSSHVSIQVGSHEGLGLGFYESISEGTPVITLDCAPHNEVITPENGWRLRCEPFELRDNSQALVCGNSFEPRDLCEVMVKILSNPEGEILPRSERCLLDSTTIWSPSSFVDRMIEGLE